MWMTPSRHNKRSHKPYGKDVKKKLYDLIEKAFKNEETPENNLNKVCEEIATGMLDALGFVAHDNTFMCAIVNKNSYEDMA